MSIKIYEAYKLKHAKYLWPLVHDIKVKATKNVKKALTQFYQVEMSEVNTSSEAFKTALESCENDDWCARHSMAHDAIRKGYKAGTISGLRDLYNFDVSVAFYQLEGSVYLIPYCDMMMRHTLDFLKKDERLRDFHYQNSTDRTKGVSAQEWSVRRRVWNKMDEIGNFKSPLILEICTYEKFFSVDPWVEMAQKYYASRK